MSTYVYANSCHTMVGVWCKVTGKGKIGVAPAGTRLLSSVNLLAGLCGGTGWTFVES